MNKFLLPSYSLVDKVHLRLASAKAVLRLSKYWDDKIPVDIFHLTLRTSEVDSFLLSFSKYIKFAVLFSFSSLFFSVVNKEKFLFMGNTSWSAFTRI